MNNGHLLVAKLCIIENVLFCALVCYFQTALLTQVTCFFHTHSPTPTKCLAIKFNFDTKSSSWNKLYSLRAQFHNPASHSDANRKWVAQATHNFIRLTTNSGVPTMTPQIPGFTRTIHRTQGSAFLKVVAFL